MFFCVFFLGSSLDQRVLVRSQTTGEVKSLTYNVDKVNPDTTLSLMPVLDRNGIPIDPNHAKSIKISVSELIETGYTVVDPTIVQYQCTER